VKKRLAAPAPHLNIEHDSILIDGAPQVVHFALDPDEELIQVPFVTRARPLPSQTAREARAELEAAPANALVGDDHAALDQNQLDITKTQAKDMIEPDRVAN